MKFGKIELNDLGWLYWKQIIDAISFGVNVRARMCQTNKTTL